MDSNATKCFICDVECTTEEKFLGTNIARTLTMTMTAVLAKCLRTIVDTENEYFCSECTRKIEEYDQMVQLSLEIETELYELFRKKPTEPCYLLDAEIIVDQSAISVDLTDMKIENALSETAPENDLNDNYDEMVVEYLDEYDAQSDDGELTAVPKKKIDIEKRASDFLVEEKIQDDGIETTEIVEMVKVEHFIKEDASDIESTCHTDEVEDVPIHKPKIKKRGRGRPPKKRVEQSQQATENNFACEQCSFIAKSHDELEAHKTIEHFEEDNRLSCDICGRTYKSKSALCVHLGTHNGRKTHECHICGKTFTQRGALVRHMPMHTGEKPHQCDVCGKRFIHYSSFHMHQMIHTNERKKTCSICGSGFRSNSHMTRHMRSHTGERPFACTICGQRFAQRYNMKTHYNTHQGIHRPQSRNHKCLICMEAFPRREKLNKHLRQDHHISDDDITDLAKNGPDSEIGMNIIERLKSSVYTKEEVLIEYIDEVGNEEIK